MHIRTRSPVLAGLVMFLASAFPSAPAWAGPVGSTLGQLGMNEEVQNLGDAVQQEATTWASGGAWRLTGATKGITVDAARGASGELAQLALGSGELICNTWLITFHLRIRNMIIEDYHLSGEAQVKHEEFIQHLQEFAAKLEQECTRVGLIGSGGATGGGTATGGGNEGATDSGSEGGPEEGGGGSDALPRPGETVADAICRHKCQKPYDNMLEEQKFLKHVEENKKWADDQVRQKQADLDGKKQKLSEAQKTLDEANRILKAGLGPKSTSADKDRLIQAAHDQSNAKREVDQLSPEVKSAQAALSKAQDFAQRVQKSLDYQRQRTEAAKRAYYECLKRCLDQAHKYHQKTNLTCPEEYGCAAAGTGDRSATENISYSCPSPPQEEPIVIGPNGDYGSGAKLKNKAESMAMGALGSALGGALGGGNGLSMGGIGDAFGAKPSGESSKGPEIQTDPTHGEFTHLIAKGVDLGVRAGFTKDGLVVSEKIFDSPGNASTFHALWLQDPEGRQLQPDRYYIFSIYADFKLTVWWTYDHWTNGVHDAHREGRESSQWRENLGDVTARFGGEKGVQNSIWYQSGFNTAVKGVREVGALFSTVTPQQLADPCPLSLVSHVTLPQNDPVDTVPMTGSLSIDPAAVESEPAEDMSVQINSAAVEESE